MAGKEPVYTPDQFRALFYRDRPYIFNGIRGTLSELLSIARTYAPLQKYEVTLAALTAVVKLLAGYLNVRDGDLMMHSSMQALMGPTEFEFDIVLTEAMEGLSALQKAAIRDADVQLAQQIVDSLEFLALRSIDTKGLFGRPDENPTTAFVRAYMFGPIQDGAARGLDDIAMGGAKAQGNIGKALLKKHQYLTVRGTIDDIEKLAHLGIVQRKAHVTGTPVKAIAEILQLALIEPIAAGHTIRAALDALQRICIAELQFKSAPFDQSLRFAIGAVIDITQPTTLSNLEAQAIQGLSSSIEQGNVAKADAYFRAIGEFNDGLWNRLVAIGTAAAKTSSFALFEISTNIAQIVKHSLWLLDFLERTKPEAVDEASAHQALLREQFGSQTLKELNWIVGATYWRIFDALNRPINKNSIWNFFPTLSHIGIQALDAGKPSLAESAIDELKSISIKTIGEPVGPLTTAAQIAVFIAKIGIVAQRLGHAATLQISVNALKEFQAKYFAKQRAVQPDAKDYDATLLNELEDLKEELRRQDWLTDEEEAAFSRRVTVEDIDNFIALVGHES